jgi:hypothetical protein
MTAFEARERAERIWGKGRVKLVGTTGNGGAWIELSQAGLASDTRDRNYQCHSLDPNGHTDCHKDCAALEVERLGGKAI